MLISLGGCYLAYQYIDHIRSTRYTLGLFSGPLQLISEGINRHQGEKQRQWILLVEKLIGLPINLTDISTAPLTPSELKKLQKEKKLLLPLRDRDQSRIWTIASETQLVSIDVKNIAEQQLRITGFLIMNELGRYPLSQRDQHVARLQQHFGYSIRTGEKVNLDIDKQQLNRVNKGEAVVVLGKDKQNHDALMLYSRFKSARQYLIVGPIPIYNATPLWLMITLLIMALGVTTLVIYLLVKSLEHRLESISGTVLNFGPETLDSRVDSDGEDAIGELAKGINVMASRIQSLIHDQKDITRAISHELKTPIARMKFRIEILKESVDKEAGEKLNKLNNDILELDKLVEELLLFQLLDSTHSAIERQVSLTEIVKTTVNEIYEPYQSIQLEVFTPDSPVVITGDQTHLRRMIQNLLVNAFKHAQAKVKLEVKENPVRIKISDDGEGIPEDQRQRIFSSFVRLDSSRNRQTGGFGLGLAIIERIARIHRAEVSVGDSEYGGAIFTVTFAQYDAKPSSRWKK